MAYNCSKCGGPLTFIEGSGKWFCGHCEAYSTVSGKKGHLPPPPPPSEDSNVITAEVETIDTYKLEKTGKGRLINAKCPNCGAMLELPEKLDRAFCQFCGGNVIIAKDEIHYHAEDALFSHKLKEINKLKAKRRGLILKRNNELNKIENDLLSLEKHETLKLNGIKKEVKQNVIGIFLFIMVLGIIFGVYTMAYAEHEPICQGIVIIIVVIVAGPFLYLFFIKDDVNDYIRKKTNEIKMEFQTKRAKALAPIEPIKLEIEKINDRLAISGFDLNEEVDVEAFKLRV